LKEKKPLKCAVINCGKTLKEGEYVTIGDKRYCKECAVLIAREELKLLSSPFTIQSKPSKEENGK